MRSAFWIVASRWAMTSVVRPSRQLRQRLLDRPLGLGVERRGRLVEDQDRRVLQEHAGDGQALLLPARELHAALADDRVEPVGQVGDHRVEPGPARRLHDLGLAWRRAGRRRCSRGSCRRRGRRPAARCRSAAAARPASSSRMSMPSMVIAPGVDLVEARQQRADRRLARAGGPDEGDRLARRGSSRLMSRSTVRSRAVAEGRRPRSGCRRAARRPSIASGASAMSGSVSSSSV